MLTLCLCVGKEQIWMYNNLVHLGDGWCSIAAKLITHGINFLFYFARLTGDINLISVERHQGQKKLIRDTRHFSGIRKDLKESSPLATDWQKQKRSLFSFSLIMKKYPGDDFQSMKYIEPCAVFMNINWTNVTHIFHVKITQCWSFCKFFFAWNTLVLRTSPQSWWCSA